MGLNLSIGDTTETAQTVLIKGVLIWGGGEFCAHPYVAGTVDSFLRYVYVDPISRGVPITL